MIAVVGLTWLDLALEDSSELLYELDFVLCSCSAHLRIDCKCRSVQGAKMRSRARTEYLVGLSEAKGHGVEGHEFSICLSALLPHF